MKHELPVLKDREEAAHLERLKLDVEKAAQKAL